MNSNAIEVPPRLKGVLALILIAGLSAAAVVYVRASIRPEGAPGYGPEDSKKYMREMELYGGRANVLASDFRAWFGSLWHGRPLAYTVAVLTLLVALAVLFFGLPLPPESADAPANLARGNYESGQPPEEKGATQNAAK